MSTPEEAEALAEHIVAEDRDHPIVAVTTNGRDGTTFVDVAEVAAAVGTAAEVVLIETGPASWALTDALPPRLDVYGGALRLWKPRVGDDADPYDHPLLLVDSREKGARAVARLTRELGLKQEAVPGLSVGADVEATVTEVDARQALVDIGGRVGKLAKSGLADGVDDPRDVLRVGQQVQGRVLRIDRGLPVLTLKPGAPDAVEMFIQHVQAGDVVAGRVVSVQAYGVLVLVYPGIRGLVHQSEVPSQMRPNRGDIVVVKVLDLGDDPRLSRLALSITAVAPWESPRPIPPLLPSGPIFLETENVADERAALTAARQRIAELEEQRSQLQAELKAMDDDRRIAHDELRRLRSDVTALRKQVRGDRERRRQLEQRLGIVAEISDADEFLAAVTAAYQRMYTKADREQHPLAAMRVGKEFLERLDALDGVPRDKVVEVCTHVASGRAWQIQGLSVHQLRSGPGGAPPLTRSTDGAQAWRCALQTATPSARRLHWWELSGHPRTVEFASVGVHDDMDIPE